MDNSAKINDQPDYVWLTVKDIHITEDNHIYFIPVVVYGAFVNLIIRKYE